jgi:predicted membrane-bound mannosyltransferase
LKKLPVFTLLVIAVILMGAFMRFFNLNWGDGNFFHPDERNIGMAVANINPEAGDYNPDFFAYGSFPIYMIYALSEGDFSLSLQYGRMLSALFSTLSLPLIYLITKRLLVAIVSSEKHGIKDESKTDKYALVALIIAAFSPGLIQFAHFTTFESFLTFEYLLFCYYSIKLLEKPTLKNYLILAVICGLAVGTKIVSLFLVPIYVLVHLIVILAKRKPEENRIEFVKKFPLKLFRPDFILGLSVLFAVFVLTNPFIFLDYEAFRGSLNYESTVARGTLPVFYTQQFIQTVPFIYQLTYVFPSILSWPLTLLGVLSLLFLTFIQPGIL